MAEYTFSFRLVRNGQPGMVCQYVLFGVLGQTHRGVREKKTG